MSTVSMCDNSGCTKFIPSPTPSGTPQFIEIKVKYPETYHFCSWSCLYSWTQEIDPMTGPTNAS